MKTTFDQKEFITGISDNIVNDIVKQIDEGKIPKEWDGHELRALLSIYHEQSASISNCMSNKNGKRYKEFKNTVLINNL